MDKQALREKSMALPLQPGVYLMKDAAGKIIYVGKAKALKNRVSNYFGSDKAHTEKVRQMVARVADFDVIVVDSEFEALVLECSLIKQYSPKYNILLKDDKGYQYIRISPPPYSRIEECRQKTEDGSRYLGPFVSLFSVRQAVDEACKVFLLPTCHHRFVYGKAQGRPCLNRYIGQCCAPCTGRVKEAAYQEQVDGAVEFLTQGSVKMLATLTARMEAAAEALQFEKAAMLRDRLAAIRRMTAGRQKVVMSRIEEQDVIAVVSGAGGMCFEVFRFAGGSLYDREHFLVDSTDDLPDARAEFVRRYYSMRDSVPPQLTMDGEPDDQALLEQWLSEKAGRRVHVVLPQIGEQAQLVEMCRANAAEHLSGVTGTSGRETAALDELGRLLGLPGPPLYIESYDISHTAGSDPVAGMVVFENGKPLKSAYRRFQIKSAAAQDDYGAMQEVLTRRMERRDDETFGRIPDLILLDGGQGHVSAVKPLIDSYGLSIPVFGMVKDDHHRTRAIAVDGGEIAIHARRSAFTLVSAIQEEVHRYAIGYHHSKHTKNALHTALTGIEGVGETRARALLRHFGSLKAVREASEEQLCAVKGIPAATAKAIYAHFEACQKPENRV